jgi:hypothetical protein
MQHLTMLELQPNCKNGDPCPPLPPGIITGRSQLQHLDLSNYVHVGNAAAVSDFLCGVEQLTQLTHLSLFGTLSTAAVASAAAYAALIASSKLQLLQLPGCNMPAGARQHVLPFGRQLQHLQELTLIGCPGMGVFDVASLVGCCPKLQRLDLPPLEGTPVVVLAPVYRLTGLQRLTVPGQSMNDAAVKALTQLTGLEELSMECSSLNGISGAGMLHLAALRQLRSLRFTYTWLRYHNGTHIAAEPPSKLGKSSHWLYTTASRLATELQGGWHCDSVHSVMSILFVANLVVLSK